MTTASETQRTPTALNGVMQEGLWRYYLLFFLSGFPALIYQIVWQRALFTIYGVNIESVTVIVTVFMLGLGLGSLAGGRLSTIAELRALRAFGLIEFSIGVFGAFSLPLFHHVAELTDGSSTTVTGVMSFLLLLIPTLLMGSTLPLLVTHLVRRTANVGDAVGSLYAVNTLGSSTACFVAALFLMRTLGESGSVRVAAVFNLTVGATAIILSRGVAGEAVAQTAREHSRDRRTMPFGVAMLLAVVSGFVALGYEILWYRVYSFASGGAAPSFALLLAFYLLGVAYGSYAVHEACKRKLKDDTSRTLRAGATVSLLAAIVAFLVSPATAFLLSTLPISYEATLVLVAIAAALTGAVFPILSHAAIGPNERAGQKLSYLYLSNIIGSALGSLLVGFVVLNYWSTGATSVFLLGLGLAISLAFLGFARQVTSRTFAVTGIVLCLVLAASYRQLFSDLYGRLLFKWKYASGPKVVDLVENRSGVIVVDSKQTVYGGGIYDGHFNTDPITDTNGIFRAYLIPGLHRAPRRVLVVGLSSGSWAQIVANDPRVEKMTIVEINPGYLSLIPQHSEEASLLKNPKVQVIIDDGRRWLVSRPDERFDFILMNTTFNWRANASNLLSVEFLQLARLHLNPGGVLYYNTTSSERVLATAAGVFPYALRISNFVAVSDSPIQFDRAMWEGILAKYRIDGRPVFDPENSVDQSYFEKFGALMSDSHANWLAEDRSDLLKRIGAQKLITDDNMGTEWQDAEGMAVAGQR